MLSKTKIKVRIGKKTNPILVETARAASKNKAWAILAKTLSSPMRKQSSMNLFEIEKQTSEGDTVIIPGKVLSKGNLTKKISLCSLAISEKAKAKLAETKSEHLSILEEIKKNPKAEGVKFLK